MKYEIVHHKQVEVKNREIDRMQKGQALKEQYPRLSFYYPFSVSPFLDLVICL